MLLIQSDSTNRVVTYPNFAPAVTLGQVTIDATGAGTMTLSMSQFAQDTLTSTSEIIGFLGAGTFNQAGGTHTVIGAMTLAARAGSQGTYNLDGGTLVASNIVPGLGTANFNFGGGTLRANGTLNASQPMNVTGGGGTVDSNGNDVTFTGTLTNSGTFTKIGAGALEIDAAPTLNNNSALLLAAGTLRFALMGTGPTIGTGVTATINNSATLELAGSVSALSSGFNRANILDNSLGAAGQPAGLIVSGQNQVVGSIDGMGITQVNAGSDLTANHIIQGALVIGGAAGSPGLVTIDASDANGNPLGQSSGFALAASLTPSGPFGAGGSSFTALSSGGSELAALSPSNSIVSRNPSPVPEPSTLALLLFALSSVIGQGIAVRCRSRWNESG